MFKVSLLYNNFFGGYIRGCLYPDEYCNNLLYDLGKKPFIYKRNMKNFVKENNILFKKYPM